MKTCEPFRLFSLATDFSIFSRKEKAFLGSFCDDEPCVKSNDH